MTSEKIKALLSDFRITLPVGVIIGVILGLVIGWGIWPVQWTDLAPYHLRTDLREDYLRMAIYTATSLGDADIAEKAWFELEDTAEETLESVRNNPLFLNEAQIASFSAVVSAEPAEMAPEIDDPLVDEGFPSRGPNWLLLGGFCLFMLLVAVGVVIFVILRGRSSQTDQPETLQPRSVYDQSAGFEEDEMRYVPQQAEEDLSYQEAPAEPIAQYMTTFMAGDDLYDDSFSIDAPTGEFLGECGVGISETIGIGEPKRVAAMEVWLFDKNDIQTVTKVIMSAHAYDDEKIRIRLESKGEPILAEPGKRIILETATLQLEARIIDMDYGVGAAPDDSFFQRMTMELAVWPKN